MHVDCSSHPPALLEVSHPPSGILVDLTSLDLGT